MPPGYLIQYHDQSHFSDRPISKRAVKSPMPLTYCSQGFSCQTFTKLLFQETKNDKGRDDSKKKKHSPGSYVKAHNSLLLAPDKPLQKQTSYLMLMPARLFLLRQNCFSTTRLVIVICAWGSNARSLNDYPCDKEMPKGELELENPSETEWIAVCTWQ